MLLTEEQKAIIENEICWKGRFVKDIAIELGLPLKPLRNYVKINNLQPKYKDKKWLQEQYDLYQNATVISENTGFSQPVILSWIRKLNIDTSHYTPRSNRCYSLNESYFEFIDSEEKAYWLGFIMADGCISSSDSKYDPNRLDILLKDDEDNRILLNQFKQDIDFSRDLEYREITNIKYGFSSDEVGIRVNSKKFVNYLLQHNVSPNKTGKEIIPKLDYELIKYFIRGYFDGDGCIKKDGRISIGSSSKIILEQIQLFAKQINVNFTIYERHEYKIPFYLIESCHFIRNKRFLDCIYGKKPKRYLKRKYQLYLSLFGSPLQ